MNSRHPGIPYGYGHVRNQHPALVQAESAALNRRCRLNTTGNPDITAMRILPVVLLCRTHSLLLKIRNTPILPSSRLDTRDVTANRHET